MHVDELIAKLTALRAELGFNADVRFYSIDLEQATDDGELWAGDPVVSINDQNEAPTIDVDFLEARHVD